MRKVLLATDGSPSSIRAARVISRLFGSQADVLVDVLFVAAVNGPVNVTDLYGHRVAPDIPVDVLVQEMATPVFTETLHALAVPRTRVRTRLRIGSPGEEIIDLTREEEYDMLVVGSRGLSQVKEIFLGSVSQKVLHGALCPVLVVRPELHMAIAVDDAVGTGLGTHPE